MHAILYAKSCMFYKPHNPYIICATLNKSKNIKLRKFINFLNESLIIINNNNSNILVKHKKYII